MSNYNTLAVLRKITIAGNHKLKGDATGVTSGTIIDEHRKRQSVGLAIVVVSRLGKNLFSVPESTSERITTVFELNDSRIETSGDNLPLQQVAGTRDLFSFNVEVDAPNVALPAKADVDTWHRRVGHINSKCLGFLNTTNDNDVSIKRRLSPCDVCAIGKSTQQAHSKTAALNIEQPFELIYTDRLRSITPTARGLRYASKFTDEKIRWKENLLLKSKADASESLLLFAQGVVAPLGYRIQPCRAGRGSEYTGEGFWSYFLQTAINLEFAATNELQQVGASDRQGRTLAAKTQCLLVDSGLPKYLWAELTWAATYLANLTPHSALNIATPYKALVGKEAHLSYLKIIGARTFVHVETHTRKLDDKAWEGRQRGYSQDT